MAISADSQIFKQCLQQACLLSHALMVQLVQQVVALMQAKQDKLTDMRERIQWDDDARALLQQREALADVFATTFQRVLDVATQSAPGSSFASLGASTTQSANLGTVPTKALRFDQLELVDDAQVQGQIETGRLQQSAEAACERELADLDALVCAARGLKTVQPERNPLRPRTFGAAITQALAQMNATPAQRVLWTQLIGTVLGPELRKLYPKLAIFLQNQQVQAVSYGGSFAMQGAGNGGSGGNGGDAGGSQGNARGAGGNGQNASGGSAAPGAKNARPATLPKRERSAQAPQLSVDQLRQVLGGEHFRQPRQQSRGAQQHYRPGTSSQSEFSQDGAGYDDAAQDDADQDESMYDRSSSPDGLDNSAQPSTPEQQQALAQDVVRLLVNALCDNQSLLECVRDWVGSLEPALLALAKVDSSFLTNTAHSARRMLDEVASRSLGFGADTADGFAAFFNPVLAASAPLLPHAVHSAQPFDQAWQAIQEAWSHIKTAGQLQREQAQQALAEAEQRSVLAERIALELTRRDDARLAPIFVKQFLASVWSHVLAKARLDTAAPEKTQLFEDTVAQLLWSVVLDYIAQDRQRLVRMIPGMLANLREGLHSIGAVPYQTEVFFGQLMDIHQVVLSGGKARARLPDSASAQANPALAAGAAAPTATTGKAAPAEPQADPTKPGNGEEVFESAVWLAPQEMLDAGFVEADEPAGLDGSDEADALEEDEGGERAEDHNPAQEGAAFAQTQPTQKDSYETPASTLLTQPPSLGSWIEFLSQDQWVRAQLTWASPQGTLFMFTGAAGNPHTMTRRALDKMLARQAMRSAQQGSIVSGALQAVAQAALRSSQAISA